MSELIIAGKSTKYSWRITPSKKQFNGATAPIKPGQPRRSKIYIFDSMTR